MLYYFAPDTGRRVTPRCDACTRFLSVRQVLRCALGKAPRSFPFTDVHGSRSEFPVRYLCRNCEARREHLGFSAAAGSAAVRRSPGRRRSVRVQRALSIRLAPCSTAR
jgi:hypothetical protein